MLRVKPQVLTDPKSPPTDEEIAEVAKILGVAIVPKIAPMEWMRRLKDRGIYPLPFHVWANAVRTEYEEHGPRDYGNTHPHVEITNVTQHDVLLAGKIALAHLLKHANYYKYLEEMEKNFDAEYPSFFKDPEKTSIDWPRVGERGFQHLSEAADELGIVIADDGEISMETWEYAIRLEYEEHGARAPHTDLSLHRFHGKHGHGKAAIVTTNVIGYNVLDAARIAVAHFIESPTYYDALRKSMPESTTQKPKFLYPRHGAAFESVSSEVENVGSYGITVCSDEESLTLCKSDSDSSSESSSDEEPEDDAQKKSITSTDLENILY
jgi:hypothetical protein